MKVQDLKGPHLDYWVAKAEGVSPYWLKQIRQRTLFPFSYSTEPNRGLMIIEREKIGVDFAAHLGIWQADVYTYYEDEDRYVFKASSEGESLLEAAMRCYVKSKFGDEVPDE